MKKLFIAILMSCVALPVTALERIAGYPNWSGYWNVGIGGGYTESNFLAGIDGIGVDLGDDIINGLGSPDSKTYALPVLGGQFAYTLDNDKTHFIFGNAHGDLMQFEYDFRVALQHDFDFLGSFRAAYLAPSYISTEVWSDPYGVGFSRSDTEQSSTGGRFTWDKILSTGLELKATYRDREIDEEFSGQSLGLTFDEQALLSREGDIITVELGYRMKFGSKKHSFRPSVTYVHRDLDGAAMAQEGIGADLTYTYTGRGLRWITNFGYTYLEGDEKNPIFDKTNDANRFMFSSKAFFPRMFGWKNWMPVINLRMGMEDSDIDFNDSTVAIISTTLFRNF
jgi:hypothetical protein